MTGSPTMNFWPHFCLFLGQLEGWPKLKKNLKIICKKCWENFEIFMEIFEIFMDPRWVLKALLSSISNFWDTFKKFPDCSQVPRQKFLFPGGFKSSQICVFWEQKFPIWQPWGWVSELLTGSCPFLQIWGRVNLLSNTRKYLAEPSLSNISIDRCIRYSAMKFSIF